jgi:uncharacterized protein
MERTARKAPKCTRMAVSIILAAVLATVVVPGSTQAASAQQRLHIENVSPATVVRLAKRGNSTYQTHLGYMYETGNGVPQDYRLAAFWYSSAAEQGNVRAQHLLGMLYDRGLGLPRDHVEAHKWLNLAASRAPAGDRDYFVRIRNAVASKLTLEQTYEAQRRAREWSPRQGPR